MVYLYGTVFAKEETHMKKAVMYGAGNIGRGFIGKVFSDSGYEVCFLDIVSGVIDELNWRHEYPVRIVANQGNRDEIVKNVRAVHALSNEAIAEIASCDIMATAVGVNVLPKIAPVIANGIIERMKTGRPLDIILCENQLEADILMRGWINEHLDDDQRKWADKNIGFVEASIGRMVPVMTPEQKTENPLLVCVEPYAQLPVDSAAFRGPIPCDLVGLLPYSPFGLYIKRKLFIHNMGHAICAYMGAEKGYHYIWQAAEDKEIYCAAREAMMASANALAREYGEEFFILLEEHVDDLLFRFKNHELGDTVARVGGDPVRKLRRDDRLTGAALYCVEFGITPVPIINGIRAALRYNNPADVSAPVLQADLREKGLAYVLKHYLGLDVKEPFFERLQDQLSDDF
jgi:mannitol-1-phosphate 5-dehydrogenase